MIYPVRITRIVDDKDKCNEVDICYCILNFYKPTSINIVFKASTYLIIYRRDCGNFFLRCFNFNRLILTNGNPLKIENCESL